MKSADIILATAQRAAMNDAVTLRFAEVTAVAAKHITVDLDGIDVPNVPFLKSYTPTVGDRAWLLYQGTTLVALGAN